MQRWTCSCCGKQHEGIPDSYSYDAPWYWGNRDKSLRTDEYFLNKDYCVIANQDFFIRGCIELPVHGSENPFLWGVWCSLSKKNLNREAELADSPERIHEPPYFGWLSNRIEIYPDTLSLKCNMISRLPGQHPLIQLEPSDHPLMIEQQQGITFDRVIELAEQIEHQWKHPAWRSIDN
jgi:hypothetical protein